MGRIGGAGVSSQVVGGKMDGGCLGVKEMAWMGRGGLNTTYELQQVAFLIVSL